MKIKVILAVINLFIALSISFGFTAHRKEWSTVPQLDQKPKASMKVLMKDFQVKAIDDALKTLEEKKSLAQENATKAENLLREKRFNGMESNLENRTDFIVKLITEPNLRLNRHEKITHESTKKSIENGPLNVILMMIDGLDKENLPFELENAESFPVHGFLKACEENFEDINSSTKRSCDCNNLLRSNIARFLTWAHHIKNMTISTLYEIPTIYSSRLEMDSQSRPQLHRIDRQFYESWQLNDDRKDNPSKLSAISTNKMRELTKAQEPEDNNGNEEGLWHVSDILTRLREAFFRTLLKSLSGGDFQTSSENESHRDQSFLRKSNFIELANSALEALNSIPNKQGWVLVATGDIHELSDALELYQPYLLSSNTLLVLMSTCPRTETVLAPLFARGPGSERLVNLKSLNEVPDAIRTAINENECRESSTSCAEIHGHNAVVPLTFDASVLTYDEADISPSGRFPREQRSENKTEERIKKSDKSQEKVPESKKSTTKKPVTTNMEKKGDAIINADVQIRMGDETTAKNSQEVHSRISVIVYTIITFSIAYTLRY